MICDWVGAGIVYSKTPCDFNKPYPEPWEYYEKCTSQRIIHEETTELIVFFLSVIRDFGVNSFCQTCKKIHEFDILSKYNNIKKSEHII